MKSTSSFHVKENGTLEFQNTEFSKNTYHQILFEKYSCDSSTVIPSDDTTRYTFPTCGLFGWILEPDLVESKLPESSSSRDIEQAMVGTSYETSSIDLENKEVAGDNGHRDDPDDATSHIEMSLVSVNCDLDNNEETTRTNLVNQKSLSLRMLGFMNSLSPKSNKDEMSATNDLNRDIVVDVQEDEESTSQNDVEEGQTTEDNFLKSEKFESAFIDALNGEGDEYSKSNDTRFRSVENSINGGNELEGGQNPVEADFLTWFGSLIPNNEYVNKVESKKSDFAVGERKMSIESDVQECTTEKTDGVSSEKISEAQSRVIRESVTAGKAKAAAEKDKSSKKKHYIIPNVLEINKTVLEEDDGSTVSQLTLPMDVYQIDSKSRENPEIVSRPVLGVIDSLTTKKYGSATGSRQSGSQDQMVSEQDKNCIKPSDVSSIGQGKYKDLLSKSRISGSDASKSSPSLKSKTSKQSGSNDPDIEISYSAAQQASQMTSLEPEATFISDRGVAKKKNMLKKFNKFWKKKGSSKQIKENTDTDTKDDFDHLSIHYSLQEEEEEERSHQLR